MLNRMCYFNKICTICGLNPHLHKLCKFGEYICYSSILQRYKNFPRGLLFWRAYTLIYLFTCLSVCLLLRRSSTHSTHCMYRWLYCLGTVRLSKV